MIEEQTSPKASDYNLHQLYDMGVQGMEAKGIQDAEIYGWLESPQARSFVVKRGDIPSVLLEAGWNVERYQTVLEGVMDKSSERDVYLESYRKRFTAVQQESSG